MKRETWCLSLWVVKHTTATTLFIFKIYSSNILIYSLIFGILDGSIGIYDEHNGIELERKKLGDKCEISDMQVFDEYEKTTRDNNLLD